MLLPKPQTAADFLWPILKYELQTVAEREPALAYNLSRFVSPHNTFAHALALRLAQGLALADLTEENVTNLLIEGMRARPDIAINSAQDLIAIQANDPASRTHAQAFLNYKGFHGLQVARVAHAYWREGRDDLAIWLSNRASAAFGPDIHPAVQLGSGIMLDHGSGIVIGETAVIEDGVTIMQNVTLGGTGKVRGDRHPKVRKGVMIGAGANVIGNIELGAFSKIAAGSVVLKNVPAQSTVAGIPAQIVRIHQSRNLSRPTNSPAKCFSDHDVDGLENDWSSSETSGAFCSHS